MIELLTEIVEEARKRGKKRLAVAYGQDSHTLEAVYEAYKEGLEEPTLYGDKATIERVCEENGLDLKAFNVVDEPNDVKCVQQAVAAVVAGNADVLRLMGVVDGVGGNRFNPGQKLTRAQFCTMVVNFMGMGDDVVLHSTRTIFTDVPSSHWARGYVNLAASTMLEDGGASGSGSDSEQKPAGTPLISGIGDGRFLPDSQLTYAQAVTILIRVLGYSSSKVGAVWPDGYLNLAQSIGLTDGISAGPNDLIDRAQAAQLFVNALSCETGDGKEYYTTLGSAKEDTILLAVNTETDDGSAMGAVRTPRAWILTPLLRHPCARAFREEYAPEVPEHGTDNDAFTLKVYYPSDLQPQETEILRFEDREPGNCTVQPHFDYPHAYLADLPRKLPATGVGRGYRADEAAEETPPPRKEVQLRAPLFEQGEKKLTPAEIGTAHHLFMQFCDFDAACAPNGVENELNRLAEKKILSTEQAHAVDKRKIERFFASDLYKTFMAENKVRREFKFSVLVPAQAYFPVAADAPEENVLLQGVIDCLIETRDGFVILDFKTDRIKKGGAVERAEQYRPQLAAYARAVHEIYGRPVRACVLYFFHTGDTEWVSLDED